jgi:hypothetical protein
MKKYINFMAILWTTLSLAVVVITVVNINLSLNSNARKAAMMLENVEAISTGESTGAVQTEWCYILDTNEPAIMRELKLKCDPRTSSTAIYPCPANATHMVGERDRCVKNVP